MSVENAGIPASQDPLVGSVIGGRYRIAKKLGEGGMGAVYVGEQQMGTNVRKVAVKTLHPHLSHDPKILARFERECGVVSELQHPNTIQVFDFGKTDTGLLYIVMEFVEGRSVADILEKDGPMEPSRVVRILTQVCGSLHEAHQRGIVHRDLKPDNVVLAEKAGQKDWVEVLDFGIAKRSTEEDKEEAKLTQQGMVLGTPPYMSPEQFTGKPVDARSDIYSLAIMAYEMLTGRLPFAGNTAWEWASAHMTAPPVPIDLTPTGPKIPAAMKSAIIRALAKRPEDRYASVMDFLHAFTGATADTQPIAALEAQAAQAAVRARTEVGTPLQLPPDAFGPGPGFPAEARSAPGPMPVMAPAPAGPSRKKSGGGNKGTLLMVAGGLGIASVAAIVLALRGSRPSVPTPEPVPSEAPPTVVAPTTTDTAATATAAPTVESTTGGGLAPLEDKGTAPRPSTGGGSKPSGGTGGKTSSGSATTGSSTSGSSTSGTTTPGGTAGGTTAGATSAGGTSAGGTTAGGTTGATPTPTTPPASDPGNAEKICSAARAALARDPNSALSKTLAAKCAAAGGKL